MRRRLTVLHKRSLVRQIGDVDSRSALSPPAALSHAALVDCLAAAGVFDDIVVARLHTKVLAAGVPLLAYMLAHGAPGDQWLAALWDAADANSAERGQLLGVAATLLPRLPDSHAAAFLDALRGKDTLHSSIPGLVVLLDALTAAQVAAGLLLPTPLQLACCDVDSSGAVAVLDALVIAQDAAGLPAMLVCQ